MREHCKNTNTVSEFTLLLTNQTNKIVKWIRISTNTNNERLYEWSMWNLMKGHQRTDWKCKSRTHERMFWVHILTIILITFVICICLFCFVQCRVYIEVDISVCLRSHAIIIEEYNELMLIHSPFVSQFDYSSKYYIVWKSKDFRQISS